MCQYFLPAPNNDIQQTQMFFESSPVQRIATVERDFLSRTLALTVSQVNLAGCNPVLCIRSDVIKQRGTNQDAKQTQILQSSVRCQM